MNPRQQKETKHISDNELSDLIIDCMSDIKGNRIVKLNLTKLDDAPTNYFIVCDGDSNTQVNAIADRIKTRVKKETGVIPSFMEGKQNSTWILIDYFSVVVHVFYKETRAFYEIEKLWSDAEVIEYDSL